MADDVRPPIPMSCAHRPTVGGLVAPFVNMRLADGGVDFRSPHNTVYERCWRERLCQTCGHRLPRTSVIFGGPNQLRKRHFDEPPLCAPCAVYASSACPMVAGRQERYASHPRISEGKRGEKCSRPGCECGGVIPSDPEAARQGGDPAHPWYACYLRTGAWQLTGRNVACNCGERSCREKRLLLNGAQLLAMPLKVVLASAPGEGRTWRALAAAEVAELMPEPVGGAS